MRRELKTFLFMKRTSFFKKLNSIKNKNGLDQDNMEIIFIFQKIISSLTKNLQFMFLFFLCSDKDTLLPANLRMSRVHKVDKVHRIKCEIKKGLI